MTLKEKLNARAAKLKADIPVIALCLTDRGTPLIAKILAAIAVAYALSPVDLIPDFIPVLGYLDDVLLLPGLVALAIRLIPPEVRQRNEERAAAMWENGRPKRWYCAIPVIALWLLLVWVILKAVW